MAVQFEEDPVLYDRLLGPTLNGARGSGRSRLRALASVALDSDLERSGSYIWILKNGRQRVLSGQDGVPRFRQGTDAGGASSESGTDDKRHQTLSDLVQEGGLWNQIWAEAEEEDARSTSLARREVHMIVATKLCAGLLRPLPSQPSTLLKGNVNARVLLAVLSLRILEADDITNRRGGRKTPQSTLMSEAALEAFTGLSHDTIRRTRVQLEAMRLIRYTSRGPMRAARYALPAKELAETWASDVAQYQEYSAGIVAGETNAVAGVILSITDPVWGYSDVLDHRHWLVLLADVAGIEVSSFGVRPIMERKLRLALDAAHLTPAHVPKLALVLDMLGGDPSYGKLDDATGERLTARAAHARANDAYAAVSAKNAADAGAERKAKDRIYGALDPLLIAHPMPEPYTRATRSRRRSEQDDPKAEAARKRSLDEFGKWILGMHADVIRNEPDEEFRTRGGAVLEKRLLARGYGAGTAANAVAFIMRAPATAKLMDYMQRQPEPAIDRVR